MEHVFGRPWGHLVDVLPQIGMGHRQAERQRQEAEKQRAIEEAGHGFSMLDGGREEMRTCWRTWSWAASKHLRI